MSRLSKLKFLSLLAVMVAALAAVAVGASAHSNSGARADTDGDGASNRCETQVGSDPADPDSNDDGTVDGLDDTDGDGANNAAESKLKSSCTRANTRWRIRRAEVVSFADGVLTLKVGNKGGLIAKPLSSRAVILVPDVDDSTDDSASISRRGGDDESGDDNRGRGRGGDDGPGDDNGGRGRGTDDGPGHHSHGHGSDDDDEVAGTTADLTAGTVVRDARIKRGKFVRIRISDES